MILSFDDYNVVTEAFDLESTSYRKNIAYNTVMQSLPQYKDVQMMMTYSFEVSGNEYVAFRFVRNGKVEFHFADYTGANVIPRKDVFKVFATVLRIIYDNKAKDIRIVFLKDREEPYRKIFDSVKDKYFSEYNIGKTYYIGIVVDAEGKEHEQFAFDLSSSSSFVVESLKEALRLNGL